MRQRLKTIIKAIIGRPLVTPAPPPPVPKQYLEQTGWYRSVAESSSVDRDGNSLPWLTYPAIDFLNERVAPHFSVFEYGCGQSTLWWAQRVAKVIAIEHDRDWHDKVASMVPGNVDLQFYELEYGGEYCQAVTKYEREFDIIVIDGRDRVNCGKHSLQALKPTGVILWDNSDREQYQEGIDLFIANGFRRLDFTGITPMNCHWCMTSILYRPNDNCLGI